MVHRRSLFPLHPLAKPFSDLMQAAHAEVRINHFSPITGGRLFTFTIPPTHVDQAKAVLSARIGKRAPVFFEHHETRGEHELTVMATPRKFGKTGRNSNVHFLDSLWNLNSSRWRSSVESPEDYE